jgi:putative DNA primase/helicase
LSSASNYDDVVAQLQSFGLVFDYLDIGRMRRCKIQGSRERKGWYAIHEVMTDDQVILLVGSYGIWQGAENNAQKIKVGGHGALSKDQLAAIKTRLAEDKRRSEAQRKKESSRAAAIAEAVWAKCLHEGESDYLKRKGIAAHGLRYTESGSLVVPMLDGFGRIHGLQFILPSTHPRKKKTGRDKEFWPAGMAMKGHYYLIGTPTDILLIAEGYATAASLHEATGLPVAVAFNANNLLPVAQALRKRYQDVSILVCGDDDYLTDGNPGMTSASAAALAVAGVWIVPQFSIDRENKKITDFNDLHALEGLHLVRSQVEEKLRASKWAGAKLAQVLETGGAGNNLKSLLNVPEAVDRYSLIYGAGGTMYDHQESALIPKSDVLDICVDHAWREWKLHIDRKVVRISEVGFDPTESDRNIKCNLWGGWPTKPKSGSCEILLDLLKYLCSVEENGSDANYQWVLKWLAYPIQHPGAKMRSALIFHGPQGAGKNLFFEAYAGIFGKYARVIGQAEIDDKFNDWASAMLFMIADEVVARQELFHIKNKIKALITGETIRINPKNVAAHDERNHVNIVFFSNERQPLVLEKDDRRFAVFWTPVKMHDNYYADVAEEIKAGGIDALHDYLLNLDLGDFNEHSKPPATRSKQDLIDINLDSIDRFMVDWTEGSIGLPVVPCISEHLYRAYQDWCRKNGVSRPRELNQLIGTLVKIPGWDKKRPLVYRNYQYTGAQFQPTMMLPPENLIPGDKKKQPASTSARWLTDSYLDFYEALRGDDD